MKRMKNALILVMLALFALTPALSLAEDATGAAATADGQTYTVEQMLTYALQDEYAARAEYTAILAAYGNSAPFANTLRAEETHVTELLALFATYGLVAPADTAAGKATAPATLAEAYAAGVAAETANIAMYARFLAQADLPADVSAAFATLSNASQNHLAAFTRSSGRYGQGQRAGWTDDDTYGMMYGRGRDNSAAAGTQYGPGTCFTDGVCPGCGRTGGGRNGTR